MAWKQKVSPNVNVPGYSGGCLAYVDDGVNPPNRQPTAQMSWELAVRTGVAHKGEEPPLNVWVPVYYTIENGQWAGYGHVAWFYSNGKDTLIYDSEFGCGNRTGPYSGGQELFNYMGWQMSYLGWSEAVDGLRIVENVEEKPATSDNSNNIEIKGEEDMIFYKVVEGNAKGTMCLFIGGKFVPVSGDKNDPSNIIYQKEKERSPKILELNQAQYNAYKEIYK